MKPRAGVALLVFLLGLCAGLAHAQGAANSNPVPQPAPASTSLPPANRRPMAVLERIRDVGLLLPTAQQVASAVILELNRRYGESAIVLEDELHNMKQLRRMSGGHFQLPPDLQKSQDARMVLLDWATKEAPYRVRIGFKAVKKEYVASAECRERSSSTVIHRVEGRARTYDGAVEDLKPKLKTFCAVLDGAATQQGRRVVQ